MRYEGWAIYEEPQIARIQAAADILSRLFGFLAPKVRPGVPTAELDALAEDFIRAEGAEPAFKGYKPPFEDAVFPATLCISVDDEIVHGLPAPDKVLRAGQIVSIDCGVRLEGFHADMAYTFAVGEVAPPVQKLLWVTHEALRRGIAQAKAGACIGDIGHAIHTFVKSYTFAVSEQLTGHGVGEAMHMPPDIPNIGRPGKGSRLPGGLVIAVEPMVHMGSGRIRKGEDGWVIRTRDGSLAAHFEHTVLVQPKAARPLTSFEPIHKALAHA